MAAFQLAGIFPGALQPAGPMNLWQSLRLVCIIVALGATVWLGTKGGVNSLHAARTTGQFVASAAQVLYGVLAVVCLVTLIVRPAWTRPALAFWAAALAVAGGLAPVFWGGSGWWIGLLSGLVTLLFAGLVAWGALAHLRMRGLR